MLAILLYHGVDSGEQWERNLDAIDREYVLSRARFEQHLQFLATRRILISPLAQSTEQDGSRLHVALSFDDGDVSGYTTAAPLLEHHGFRGDFFIVTQWIGRPGFMTAAHLRDLAARGHGIHSHSRSHRRLPDLSRPEIDDELAGSKADLEQVLGKSVHYFSIPGGAYDDRVAQSAVRAGYGGVLNSVEGYNDPATPILRRFTARSYTNAATLAGICEWPRYTAARVAFKRTALAAARQVMGARGYERLRKRTVSRWLGR